MSRSYLCALCALLFISAPALAAYSPLDVAYDNFDRAPSSRMGNNWHERQADFFTVGTTGNNGQAQCSNFALAEYVGANALGAGDWVSVDAGHNSSQAPQYVGLVLGYANPQNNIQVRLQDNNGGGRFNRLFFRYGNGPTAGPWESVRGFDAVALSGNLTNVRMRARLTDDLLIVQLDRNNDGNWDYSYRRSNVPTQNLGTGFGLAAAGKPFMDNFGGYVLPEPASAALLGIGALALIRRKSPKH